MSIKNPPIHHVVILVLDESQMLDIAGPADVFGAANDLNAPTRYALRCVSSNGGLVRMTNGLTIQTESITDQPRRRVDTLVVAGATESGLRLALRDETLAKWVQRIAAKASRIASVCVGAFALADWGLLNHRRATTHWAGVELLQKYHPSVDVDRQSIFVQDGKFWTSGGVTTGIDLALAMVEADTSKAWATQIAARLVMSQRRMGNQAQHSHELQAQAGRYATLTEWMKANLKRPLTIDVLAHRSNQTERSFCRHFAAEVGQTPAQYVEALRLEAAKRALQSAASVKAAAQAAGYTSSEHLARSFRRRLNMTPQTYRELYGR